MYCILARRSGLICSDGKVWKLSQIALALRSLREVEDMMLSFSRFEARGAASPLHGEVCSDEARLAWSYAQTVSRTHSSMRLSSLASTSWLANSSESCWARSR